MTPDNTRELIAEAEDAIKRINPNAFYHDLLFQYRGGVLGREVSLILKDLTSALAALTTPQELPKAEREARCPYSHQLDYCTKCGWTRPTPSPQEEDARERLHAKCDCVPNLGPAHCHLCGNEYLRCECSHGAAPVLPSSGVDVDALAEVIRQQFEVGNIYLDSFECKIAARAVAEWLKGQGR